MAWFRPLVAVRKGTTAALRQWRSECASTSASSPAAKETPVEHSAGAAMADLYGVLTRRGKHWYIRYQGEPEFVIDDLIGMRYIAILLERPNRKFSSFELQCMRDGVATGISPPRDDEHLDPDAFLCYFRELEDLHQDLECARQMNNQAEVSRLNTAIMSIQAELRRGSSFNGRLRSHGPNEQARKNVQKAISRALKLIATCSPSLHSHLRCIDMGAEVIYEPEILVVWEVSY